MNKNTDRKFIEGAEAQRLNAEVKRNNTEKRIVALNAAKAEAQQKGKELFRLELLSSLCDTSHETPERFEMIYYVEHPDILTIAELAEIINKSNFWDYGY
jgi:hypothetical protein